MYRYLLALVFCFTLSSLNPSECQAQLTSSQQHAVVSLFTSGKRSFLFGGSGGGQGSAFFISPDYLLTANHCVSTNVNNVRIMVNGEWVHCDVIHRTRTPDMALLKTRGYRSPIWLNISDKALRSGELVYSYANYEASIRLPQNQRVREYDYGYAGGINRAQFGMMQNIKTSRVRGGYSGGPAVHAKRREVVGIVSLADQYGDSHVVTINDIRDQINKIGYGALLQKSGSKK